MGAVHPPNMTLIACLQKELNDTKAKAKVLRARSKCAEAEVKRLHKALKAMPNCTLAFGSEVDKWEAWKRRAFKG